MELDHLREVFVKNGYHKKIIDKVIHQVRKRKQSTHMVDIPKISLPYIKGTTDRILRKQDIPVTFTPPNTIGKMVDSAKDQVDPRNQKGMYIIPCSCGKVYIGETGRSLNIRFKEHALDITRDRANKSALAEHHLKRQVKEAVEIDKRDNTLNRDDGLKLSGTLKSVK